jgi:hypothetical protein
VGTVWSDETSLFIVIEMGEKTLQVFGRVWVKHKRSVKGGFALKAFFDKQGEDRLCPTSDDSALAEMGQLYSFLSA